ncbi:MAG: ferredoxin-type protein NapG [Bacteroidetes bacterium 4484_249]|nr:MAG: ferredoxin-type protein NapG [Bacteroidetes bacterium 4484_249]
MSEEKKQITSRRNAIRKVVQGAGYFGLGGLVWGAYLDKAKASKLVLRAPGALDEDDFLRSCIKCGTCVEACPYDSLKLAKPEDNTPIGTPYFLPRDIPCYMCPDIPCVPVCPSGALDVKKVSVETDDGTGTKLDINKAQMGLAVIDEGACIAFWGIQCDACYRACPLLDSAIVVQYERNERTGKHAFLKPVVNSDVCTGCGLCEHACVTEKAAIRVLPREIAMGKVGDHYIKGWDEADEQRLKNIKSVKEPEDNEIPAEDYLNNWEELIDE